MESNFGSYILTEKEKEQIKKRLKKDRIKTCFVLAIWLILISPFILTWFFIDFANSEIKDIFGMLLFLFLAFAGFLIKQCVNTFLPLEKAFIFMESEVIDAWIDYQKDGVANNRAFITFREIDGTESKPINIPYQTYKNRGEGIIVAFDKNSDVQYIFAKNDSGKNDIKNNHHPNPEELKIFKKMIIKRFLISLSLGLLISFILLVLKSALTQSAFDVFHYNYESSITLLFILLAIAILVVAAIALVIYGILSAFQRTNEFTYFLEKAKDADVIVACNNQGRAQYIIKS